MPPLMVGGAGDGDIPDGAGDAADEGAGMEFASTTVLESLESTLQDERVSSYVSLCCCLLSVVVDSKFNEDADMVNGEVADRDEYLSLCC
mmetsp:Transcript_461/g.987  ORF Transcript_461/g.987 Transcript_461/m.987 type:complete len:90 (-) Transcript_461:694-963(-)